ncbi:hypothetical protein NDU88_000281, partial [Pleurodeles waltl]
SGYFFTWSLSPWPVPLSLVTSLHLVFISMACSPQSGYFFSLSLSPWPVPHSLASLPDLYLHGL